MKKGKTGGKFRHVDSASWSALFALQGSSGLSIKDFCASQGVCVASYYRWRKQIQAVKERGVGLFSPIEIQAKPTGLITVELPGGILLRFPQLPPVGYLRELSSTFLGG